MRQIAIAYLIVLTASMIAAQEPVWRADFAAPDAGFGTYREDSPVIVSEAADADAKIVRAEAPGRQHLEGLRTVTAPVLTGGTRCTIRAEVRGTGDVWLIAHSRNGWLYSRQTATLTPQWQTLELTKPLDLQDDRLTVCLVNREAAPMTVEVRSLAVFAEPQPTVYDVPIAPIRIEAEDFSALDRYVAQSDDASGGAVVRGSKHALLSGIPCPRTSRPIYLFARVRMADAASSWGVVVDTGGGSQRINTLSGEDTRDPQWIGGAPFTAAMVGDSFRLQLYGSDDAPGDSELDCIVLTTLTEPTTEQLEAAAGVSLASPMLTVARAEAAPVLDGAADEACWRQALVLSGFSRVGAGTPARHHSQMRMCLVSEDLYVAFRGEEPVLRPEMNRLHDFRRNVTERDADVWKDDSIALILDTGEGLYDFFINANGAVNDSRITNPANMWGSRDTSFNADVESVSQIGDGHWTVEARIGLSSLGGDPAANEGWRFIAGRIEQADSESSAWNLCAPGLHDPRAFADLRFTDAAPGAAVTLPEPVQPGRNVIVATLQPSEEGALLGTILRRGENVTRSWAFGEGPGEVAAPLAIEGEGDVSYSYALLNASDLQPLIVSPTWTRSVRSTAASVALTTGAPWRLLVNGEVAGAGASADGTQPLQVFLSRGVNAFALELEDEAQVRIEAGDLAITAADPWRVAPDDVADASAAQLDPRGWEVATGERIGPGRLRFELLWEDTRVFPNSQPALYVCEGESQHLTVAARGLPGHVLEGYRCHFWLPEPLELAEVSAYYGTREEQPKYSLEIAGTVQIDGVPHTHYVASTEQQVRYSENVRILEVFNIFLDWREGAQPEERDYSVHYASEALGGSIREARRSFNVRPLPALEGQQPDRLVWQLWGSFFSSMNKASAKTLTMETMRAAGFNNIVGGDRETSDLGDAHGVENVLAVNFESWSINMAPWVEEHPDAAQISRSGESNPAYACTSALLDEAWPFAVERLQELIAERHPDWVTWDFEYSVMTGQISCFCPRCLAAFVEHAGLAANLPLDGATIERDYLPQWTEFMNRRMAVMALNFKQACHGADPPARLQVYSGYQSEDTKWRYGVDWAMIGELQACDIASCGYGRNYERVKATREALRAPDGTRGIPLVVGRLMHPYDRNSDDPVTPLTRAVMLRRLMDCTGGVLVYDRMPVEGRSWQASAEVSRLAAAHDDIFADGDFPVLPGVPEDAEWAGARSLGDTIIVALMNTSSQPRTLSLTLPEGYARCTEFFTGEAAAAGAEVSLELAGGDARAWVLTR